MCRKSTALWKCCQQPFAHFVSFRTFSATLLTLKYFLPYALLGVHMSKVSHSCFRCRLQPLYVSTTRWGIIGSKHIYVFLPLVKITVQFLKCIDVYIHCVLQILPYRLTSSAIACPKRQITTASFPRILKETLLLGVCVLTVFELARLLVKVCCCLTDHVAKGPRTRFLLLPCLLCRCKQHAKIESFTVFCITCYKAVRCFQHVFFFFHKAWRSLWIGIIARIEGFIAVIFHVAVSRFVINIGSCYRAQIWLCRSVWWPRETHFQISFSVVLRTVCRVLQLHFSPSHNILHGCRSEWAPTTKCIFLAMVTVVLSCHMKLACWHSADSASKGCCKCVSCRYPPPKKVSNRAL